MQPAEKPKLIQESNYLLLPHNDQINKKGVTTGDLFLRKTDGNLVSLRAEVYSSRSKFKEAHVMKADCIGLEIIGNAGKQYVSVSRIEASKKMGDEFPLIGAIAQDKAILKNRRLSKNLPEADQHLRKIFERAVESDYAIEISPTSSLAKHTYTVVNGDVFLHVNDKLGQGGFKTVKLAKNIFENEHIVISHIKDEMNFTSRAELKAGVKALQNEYLMHKKFQGIGFMKVHSFILYKNKTATSEHAIVAAYYPTDLKKVITGPNAMPRQTQMKAMFELSLAIAKMHQEHYADLDIKPDNIYLKWDPASPENIEVGLGDFGEVKELTSKNFRKMDEWAGTPDYHSPERYAKVYRTFAKDPDLCQKTFKMDLEQISKANDVYALGKVFLELNTGRLMTHDEGVAFAKGEIPQDPILALAWHMMRLDPSQRFTIQNVLETIRLSEIA